eukprot:1160581-Pelagomonas_calceolata.AAC.4
MRAHAGLDREEFLDSSEVIRLAPPPSESTALPPPPPHLPGSSYPQAAPYPLPPPPQTSVSRETMDADDRTRRYIGWFVHTRVHLGIFRSLAWTPWYMLVGKPVVCKACERANQFRMSAQYISAFWQGKYNMCGKCIWNWPTLHTSCRSRRMPSVKSVRPAQCGQHVFVHMSVCPLAPSTLEQLQTPYFDAMECWRPIHMKNICITRTRTHLAHVQACLHVGKWAAAVQPICIKDLKIARTHTHTHAHTHTHTHTHMLMLMRMRRRACMVANGLLPQPQPAEPTQQAAPPQGTQGHTAGVFDEHVHANVFLCVCVLLLMTMMAVVALDT